MMGIASGLFSKHMLLKWDIKKEKTTTTEDYASHISQLTSLRE